MAQTRKLYFLSDIHIGTNEETSWYQQSVHERYLKAALKYIQKQGAAVDDVVILGDFFDLWTYAPDVQPKSINDVVAANPRIFKKQNDGSGDFITLMDKIQGKLHYINGNHDMSVKPEAVRKLLGNHAKFGYTSANPYENLWYFNGPVIALHGHEYSLLCREDRMARNYNNLPAGYFVTRTVGAIAKKEIAAARVDNCAQLPGSANPSFSLASLIPAWDEILGWATGKNRLVKSLLEYLAEKAYPTLNSVKYTMPNGRKIDGNAAAWRFRYLWVMSGSDSALKVDTSSSIKSQAQFILDQQKKHPTMLIMGHTHKKETATSSNAYYINSGYMCPSIPDMLGLKKPVEKVPDQMPIGGAKFHPTFIEVEISGNKYTARRMKVDVISRAVSSDNASGSITV